MKSYLLAFTVLCSSAFYASSQNLVLNSSFESVSTEPTNGCEFTNATSWLNPCNTPCTSSSLGNPDLFSRFSTGQAVLPNSYIGTTQPHTGDRCAGIITYNQTLADYREYFTATLRCRLDSGVTYNVSFWSTGGNPAQYIYHSNNIGLYFSTGQLTQTGYNLISGITPQLEVTTLVADSVWTFYSFPFTPNQPYSYLTIGNFRTDATTQTQSFGTNRPYAYYFFDDISVAPINSTFSLGPDLNFCGAFSQTLTTGNPNTVWSTGVTASQITVTNPGTYWASAPGTCGPVTDTIIISQSNVFTINFGGDFTLCNGQSHLLDATTPNATYLWQDGSTNPTFTVTSTGTYSVTVNTQAGCSATDAINIGIASGPPAVALPNDTTYCGNFSRLLSTGDATTIWSNGVTATQITVTQPGLYWAQISNGCGSNRDSIIISQTIGSGVNLGNDTSLCSGQSVLLDAGNTATTYLWQDNSSASTLNVTSTGIYSVTVTNATGCQASDTVNVNYLSLPTIFSLGPDASFCDNTAVTLSTSDTNTVWSTGTIAQQIIVTTGNTYWAEVSNQCGSVRDSIVLQSIPAPLVNLGADTTLCSGQSIVLSSPSSSGTYLWSNGSSNATITVSNARTYILQVSQNGCVASDTIAVMTNNIGSQFTLGPDTVVCGNELVIRLSLGNVNYHWQDNSTDSIYHVTSNGIYSVTVSNACGTSTDEAKIWIHADECELHVPTAFSPNGDGKNDLFRGTSNCGMPKYAMQVYNRWGELVFETDEITSGWDGTFRNAQQPMDVFVYYIDYFNQCEGRQKRISGNVSLIR